MTAAEFARKWRAAGVALSERAAAQSHFNDLCAVLGVLDPTSADPDGEHYAFERGVRKVARNDKGFADVWKRAHFGWEYKRAGRNLNDAYTQLLLYREDLGNPPLLVVSDLVSFEVHTNFTGTTKAVYRFGLDDLERPIPLAGEELSALDVLRRVMTDPDALDPRQRRVRVTEEATDRVGRVALALQARGHDPQAVAHFMVQLVFAFFAEDTGLLPNRLVTRILERTTGNAERARDYLGQLFAAMAAGGEVLLEDVPRFNGGLFRGGDLPPLLEPPEVRELLEVARLDWANVEPAIFGTLFMRSLDPARRSQLGAEYTSREDILRVVEPVVLEPLEREWRAVRERASQAAERLLPGGPAYAREVVAPVAAFIDRLHTVRVLDPACGSGNFLYVALQRLKDLERDAVAFARTVGAPGFQIVGPRQLFGLEVSPFAFELANAVVWIGFLQWNRANGLSNASNPVLEPLDNIRLQDALLDGTGEREWPRADFIVGNPPFLGGKRLRQELGGAYVTELFRVFNGRVARESDLVCYWFEKARAEIEAGRTRRAGLIATNSIRGGANRRVLERIKLSGGIFMAWSDEQWLLEGAAVRVSMVGFDDGSDPARVLDGESVPVINADLTSGTDVTRARRLAQNVGIAFMGDTKGGAFDIPGEVARAWLTLPNPNGRPSSDVLKPWVNGLDVTRRPRGMYIIDFGTMPERDAMLYEKPYEHVLERVRPFRQSNPVAREREQWWIHLRPRPELAAATRNLRRAIVTARVARHRLFAWVPTGTLPDSATIAFARDDDYFLGVLHSMAHEAWARRAGTSLGVGNDSRYTPSTTFETFPFPRPTPEQQASISAAAAALDETRARYLAAGSAGTMTGLYNRRPPWLARLHEDLDRAVFLAYGWEYPLERDEILARLLALNLERAPAGAPAEPVDPDDG